MYRVMCEIGGNYYWITYRYVEGEDCRDPDAIYEWDTYDAADSWIDDHIDEYLTELDNMEVIDMSEYSYECLDASGLDLYGYGWDPIDVADIPPDIYDRLRRARVQYYTDYNGDVLYNAIVSDDASGDDYMILFRFDTLTRQALEQGEEIKWRHEGYYIKEY